MSRKFAWTLLLVGCLGLLATTGAEACPNCRDSIAGDPTGNGLAQGFYYSILFMVSMPFFILGGLTSYFYYLVRRDMAEKAAAALAAENDSIETNMIQA